LVLSQRRKINKAVAMKKKKMLLPKMIPIITPLLLTTMPDFSVSFPVSLLPFF